MILSTALVHARLLRIAVSLLWPIPLLVTHLLLIRRQQGQTFSELPNQRPSGP